MDSPVKISDAGKSSLKQIFYIRDYLDYYNYLKEGTTLDATTTKIFKTKGITAVLVDLLQKFHSNPQDVKKVAKLFGLKIDKDNPKVKAKYLGAAVLTTKDGSSDLKAVIKDIKKSKLSKAGKSYLIQILYIRDYLDYHNFLKEGDKLDSVTANTFKTKGITAALVSLLKKFHSEPADVKVAAEMFGIKIDKAKPKIKAKDLGAAALPVKHDSTDLKLVICQIDPQDCAATEPAPSPTPKPEPTPSPKPPPTLTPPAPVKAGKSTVAPPPTAASLEETAQATAKAIHDRAEGSGKYEVALKEYKEANKSFKTPIFMEGMAKCYIKLKQFEKVISTYKELQKEYPDYDPGRIKEVIENYEAMILDTPEEMRAGVQKFLQKVLDKKIGLRYLWDIKGPMTFYVRADKGTGAILLGTSKKEGWINFDEDFEIVNNAGELINHDQKVFIDKLIDNVFMGGAVVGEGKVNQTLCFEVTIFEISSGNVKLDVAVLPNPKAKKINKEYKLKYATIDKNSVDKIYGYKTKERASAIYKKGEKFLEQKNYKNALKEFTEAVGIYYSPKYYFARAECYEKLNLNENALTLYEWINDFDPDYKPKEVKKKIKELKMPKLTKDSDIKAAVEKAMQEDFLKKLPMLGPGSSFTMKVEVKKGTKNITLKEIVSFSDDFKATRMNAEYIAKQVKTDIEMLLVYSDLPLGAVSQKNKVYTITLRRPDDYGPVEITVK